MLNELLEEKFLEKCGINFRLFRNSGMGGMGSGNNGTLAKGNRGHSKATMHSNNNDKANSNSYSNIDLYVEMKVMEKAKQ